MGLIRGDFELDILKELGNIGAGHAATSLSQILGRTIQITVPEVKVVEIPKINTEINTEKIVAGVVTGLNDLELGESGYLYIMIPEQSYRKIASIMLGSDENTEMMESAIMELGNILSSAFCNAIAELLGIMLMPTPPSFAMDYSLAVIDAIVSQLSKKSDYIIIFETELKDEEDSIEIVILLIPNEVFMKYILKLTDMVE